MRSGERQLHTNLVESRISDARSLESAIVFDYSVTTNSDAMIARLRRQYDAVQKFMDEMKSVYRDKKLDPSIVRTGEQELKDGIYVAILNIENHRGTTSASKEELLQLGVRIKDEAVKGAVKRVRVHIISHILLDLELYAKSKYPESAGFVNELMQRILKSEPDVQARREIWMYVGLEEGGALTRAGAGITDN